MERRIYKIKEVAQMFGVHRTTIDRWVLEGKMKSVNINGVKMITATEIDRVLKGE